MNNFFALKEDFFCIGSLDPTLKTFDIVMTTDFGTSYNSYLLKGSDKIAIFETVKDKFFDEFMSKLEAITPIDKVDYIVVNHTEPDHSGSVAKLLELNPNITVVGSALAIKYLSQIINTPFKSLIVKQNDTLSLGNKTIEFLSVPLLHWPDSMYSYIKEDHILVTCDSFGAHFSDSGFFLSKLSSEQTDNYFSAYKYYFDMIFGPFRSHIQKAINKIQSLELDFICPGHGLILDQSNIDKYIAFYNEWSTPIQRKTPSVVIAYTSAYGYTKQITLEVARGIESAQSNFDILLFDLEHTNLDEVLGEISLCSGLLIGSPTIVSDTVPPVWQLLTSLNPIVHGGLYSACFGSYGWSGEATDNIQQRFTQLKFKTPLEPLKILFKPSNDNLAAAFEFGATFASFL